MNKRNGFTLIELLIVMAIIIILAVVMVGILDPAMLADKGYDAKRKKDLRRIKIAFEEYFNDKGCYPSGGLLINLNNKVNCGSITVFSPYLIPWPCDPDGTPYKIFVEGCNKFRVVTNLRNHNDKDILDDWYTRTDILISDLKNTDVNYGVSSPNILWYDQVTKVNKTYSSCLTNQCNSYIYDSCKDTTAVGCEGDSGNCWYSSPACDNPDCKLDPGDKCPVN